jgi:hypothetical protein
MQTVRSSRYNTEVTVPLWQPPALLEAVARDPLALLRKGMGAAPFLIVRLDDFSNDLGLGLAASDEAANRRRFRGSIKSTLQISIGMTEQLRVPRLEEQSAGKPGASKANEPRSEGGAPLTIGRDTSHKIVLVHPSVSATHAQLTVGPELSLLDTKSRNGTFVNGKQVKGAVPLQVGDRIKFGAVQALICSADDLWYAVR